ncbi:MAG: hypothetical protein GXX99_01490 [Clostridiales bacterium]|nr:hypothetical protein [Clostridiales bacterium]
MRTSAVTGGGLMAAAIVVLMALSTPFPSLSLSCAAFSGFLIMFVYLKWGTGASLLCYIAASLLSLLFLPSREAAIEFIFLFGLYPMIKLRAERLPGTIACWACKMIYLNSIVVVTYFVARALIILPPELTDRLYLTLPVLNLTFVLYDIAFTRVIRIVTHRYQKFFLT